MRPAALVGPGGADTLAGAAAVADDVAVVIATSGSTGEPKGVELTASAVRHSAAATLARIGADPADRWVCCLPPSHIAGLQVLVRSLVANTDPVFLERFSPETVAHATGQHIAVVPTMLRRLLDAGVDLSRFRTVLVGGAALSGDLLARARCAGGNVVVTYGMTETAGGCVYDGVPLDEVSVDIGADGRIVIAGPVLARGYRLRPDLTAQSFGAGRLVTHDLGRRTRAGRIEVLGRVDDVIVTGGVKVVPGEVAELLATHPAIAQVAVLDRPDEEWGQLVVAVVVPEAVAAPPTLDELRRHVLEHAPAAFAPRELVVVDSLPLLSSGKVDRRALHRLRG
jgi:O-succinylbenzoic acid--CoA ligase